MELLPRSSVDRAVRFERTSVAGSTPAEATKFCTQCQKEKDVESFSWKKKSEGKRQSYCLECQKIKSKAHYKAKREDYYARNKRRMQEVMDYIDNLKSVTPCVDCGNLFKSKITDFHHKNGNKYRIVSEMRRKTTLPIILREIEKCELLCSNCHRERTFYGTN